MTPTDNGGLRGEPNVESIQAALDRILASASFRNCERLTQFLRVVVQRTLAGEGDRLKEYRIGVEVFGRPGSYDPRLDPVVRLEARRLRSKLQQYYESEGREDEVRIEVPKGGYSASFAATTLQPQAAEPGNHEPLQPGQGAADQRRQRLAIGLAVLLLIAVAAPLYWWHARTASGSVQPSSLAVLPFLNLTGDPDKEYLSDGITDELTSSLSRIPDVRVVSRTSAYKFKGKSDDVRIIGKQLGVSSILEGSVQSQGERLRITAQLIRASDGYHLWSQTYEREFKDAFAIEDEISRGLAKVVGAAIGPENEAAGRTRVADPAAHDLYLRGRYFALRTSAENAKKSIVFYNQALDQDPLFAEAYAAMAAAWAVQGANDWAPPSDVYPKARLAAQRAIELDPNLSDAHAVLGNTSYFYDWDPVTAEREYRRSIELNPNQANVRQFYGMLLHYSRRFDEALVQFKKAKDLEPTALAIDMTIALLYESQGNYAEAIHLDREVLSTFANHPFPHYMLGRLYADTQKYDEAIEESRKGIDLGGDELDYPLALAEVYARSGRRAEALSTMQEVLSRKNVFVPPVSVACVYARLGNTDETYRWLKKAVKERSPAFLTLNVESAFDPYRSEPRFQELARHIGQGGSTGSN